MSINSSSQLSTKIKPKILLALIIILLAAFILRVNQNSSQGFWNDEAEQILAALNPTFSGMIKSINSQIMAMPLDYVITRLMTNVSMSETILRLPSAIWGTLAILFFFLFTTAFFQTYRHKETLALTASAIFALTPFQIYYAQEVRFYAALTFFFWLISWLILRVFYTSGSKEFAILVIASILGVYFHPYVLLAFLLGGAIGIFGKQLGLKDANGHGLHLLSKSTLLILVAGLLAVGAFGLWFVFTEPRTGGNRYDLLRFSENIYTPLSEAFGWEPRSNYIQRSIWEYFLIISTILSLPLILLKKELTSKFLLLIALLHFGALVLVGLTAIKGYWLSSRQFIHLAPFSYLLVALVLDEIGNWLVRILPTTEDTHSRILSSSILIRTLLIAIVFLFALPRISIYYNSGRGNGREIMQKLTSLPIDNIVLVVDPYWDTRVYALYSNYYFQHKAILITVLGQLNKLGIDKASKNLFYVLPHNYSVLPFDESNYQLLLKPTYSSPNDKELWGVSGN